MRPNKTHKRKESFGMHQLSWLDQLIYRLRVHSIKKYCACTWKVVMDLGCGYDAVFLRYIKDQYHPAETIAYDLALNSSSLTQAWITCIQGNLNHPFHLAKSVDIIFATAILEHLDAPIAFLEQCYASLAPWWSLVLTTPSVRSQPILEFLAYKLHLISEQEIRDHKEYFDKDKLTKYLWKAGFQKNKIYHEYFECFMNNLIVAEKT